MNGKQEFPGAQGLVLEEPLLFEISTPGREAYSLPADDIPEVDPDFMPPSDYLREDITGMPELSEGDIVRHYIRLSSWNYSVDHGFYPLGSCTMKYNPKFNEVAAAMTGFQNLHPSTPVELSQGALHIMFELQRYMAEISGLPAVSLQPSAGAQGELAGMLIIRAYHRSRGDNQRKIVLIPDSAHGTNPASSVIAGLECKTLKSGPNGYLEPDSIEPYLDDNLAAIMMTNPNTLGIFEKNACDIACKIKQAGGLVYMDGANLNAIMGKSRPGDLGVDVMHINLHKTFSTPHGGGGPGSGPVAVTHELEPFLPVPRILCEDGHYRLHSDCPDSIGRLHNFYGNFGVMVRAYAYVRTLGPEGLRAVSEMAVLNANYLKAQLQEYYHLPYDQVCKHECVFTDKFQEKHGVTTMDIAKRLMDYGFHPPTVFFPLIVNHALMIEPTETESKHTLDTFISAMIKINKECESDPETVKNAPYTTRRNRLDETLAARKTILRWDPEL